MKIGIISDSHDNIWNLRKVLEIFKQQRVKEIIHCGDFCADFVLIELAKFKGNFHLVFGNVGDRFGATDVCSKEKNLNLYGEVGEIEIEGKKILFTHYPDIAIAFAFTGKYDLVLHGHTHERRLEKIGHTLVVNPGDVMGRFDSPSFAIYNTKKNEINFFDIE